ADGTGYSSGILIVLQSQCRKCSEQFIAVNSDFQGSAAMQVMNRSPSTNIKTLSAWFDSPAVEVGPPTSVTSFHPQRFFSAEIQNNRNRKHNGTRNSEVV